MDGMQIYFEAGGKYITAALDGKVVIRCDSDFTDIGGDEDLTKFVLRHGGNRDCAVYLKDCYRVAA